MPDATPPADKDAELLKKLYNSDPEIRRMVQKRVKKDNPAASFPELEAEERIAQTEKTFGEKLDETGASIQRTNLELARDRKRAGWEKQGLDPDAIEQTIEKYGLTGSKDLTVEQAAMRILEAEAGTAAGSSGNVREQGRMRMPDDWSKVANKPDQVINNFAQDEAHKAVDEIIASNRTAQRGFAATSLKFRRA